MDGAAALSIIVPTTGLEPATFSLGERRAIQIAPYGHKYRCVSPRLGGVYTYSMECSSRSGL